MVSLASLLYPWNEARRGETVFPRDNQRAGPSTWEVCITVLVVQRALPWRCPMCGIVGYVGQKHVVPILLEGLRRGGVSI